MGARRQQPEDIHSQTQTQTGPLDYWTIRSEGTGEVLVKNSRFLSRLTAIRSEEQAAVVLNEVRKQHRDARHHCYAWILGEQGQLIRCGDDGEPSGTAGRPILDVLTRAGLTQVLLVVTRYFGGTLLGTGGLTRAYTQAAQEALAASDPVLMRYGCNLAIQIGYERERRVRFLLEQNKIAVSEINYGKDIRIHITVPKEQTAETIDIITEATDASAVIEERGEGYYQADV